MLLTIGTTYYNTTMREWFTAYGYSFSNEFGYKDGMQLEVAYCKCLIDALLKVNQNLLQIIKDNL